MACFDGNYPLPYDADFDKYVMENRRGRARLLPPDAQPDLLPFEGNLARLNS